MAIYKSDTLRSNNPQSFAIALANEIGGHKQVSTLQDLYALPDCILSASRGAQNSDALGQIWYVTSLQKRYELISWTNRRIASGWQEVIFSAQTDLTHIQEQIDSLGVSVSALQQAQQDQAALIEQNRQAAVEGILQATQDAVARETILANRIQELSVDVNQQISDLVHQISQIDTGVSYDILSQAAYNAITTKDPNKFYFIQGASSSIIKAYIGSRKLWEIVSTLDSTAQDAFLSASQGNLLNQKYLMNAALIQYLLDLVNPFAFSYFRGAGIYEDGDTPSVQFQWAYTRPIVSQTFNGQTIDKTVTTKTVSLTSTPSVQAFTIQAVSEQADLIAQVLHTDFSQIITTVDADLQNPSSSQQSGTQVQTANIQTRTSTIEETIYVSFLQKIYYGASVLESMSNSQILQLQQEFYVPGERLFANHKFDCSGGKYIYVYVPATAYSDEDAYIEGFKAQGFERTTINVTNAKNKQISYLCFKFPKQTVGNINLEFK